jgi:hypothetical protein
MLRHWALGLTRPAPGTVRGVLARGAKRSGMALSAKLLTSCIRSDRMTHNYTVIETTTVKNRLADVPD